MKRNWKAIVLCLWLAVIVAVGCGNDEANATVRTIDVSGIVVPKSVTLTQGSPLQLQGSGILATDQLELVGTGSVETSYTLPISNVQASSFEAEIPADFVSGTYTITLIRGDQRLKIGTASISISPITDVPDRTGMTLKGVVYCDGRGVSGVVVSDGFETTTTDENGVYYLPSEKKNGYVFISVPGQYEVECKNSNEPQFFQYVTQNATTTVEQRDFALRKVDNTSYKLFVMTDFHLANRNNDLKQYANFLTDVNNTIAKETQGGVPVYGLDLGDLSWDLYWYDNNYALAECKSELNKIDCPIFNLPGNHDNDPYKANDWTSEQAWKNTIGPTYYSFNLGKVHYVMLDNIQYINNGGTEGTVGDRSYNDLIVDTQMKWLEKDLSYITDDGTPVVVAMHANFYNNPTVKGGKATVSANLQNSASLKALLSRFKEVHILTGHTHMNFAVEEGNIMEHNTAAVCATWWWTGKDGYAGNHTCKDGSPGGYSVWTVDGTKFSWYYKGTGEDRNYQFRTYDLNETQITAAMFAPNSTDDKLSPYAGAYAGKRNDNKVLINVWGYDDKWSVEATENGKSLSVSRVYGLDPLHIISYEALRLNAGKTPTAAFTTEKTAHLFEVTASSATSTLEIKVTDRFGNVYTETMTRPKIMDSTLFK